ncbi:MAG: hypothetical protein K0S01_2682 [Herbinix sp.]|jgi:hypothetical protein|nr:hypothetical protein [Herbinix sp.]
MIKSGVIKKLALVAILMGSLTACQPTPKVEVIKDKGNLDEVIQDSEADSTQEEIKDVVKAQDKREFEVKLPGDKLDILVNADLVIPEVTKVPVYEIVRKDFEDEDINKLCKILFGDSELYPELTYENMSKDELLQELAKAQAQAEEFTVDDEVAPEKKEKISEKFNSYIEMLQTYISNAPESVVREPIKEFKMKADEENAFGGDMKYFSAQGKVGETTGHFIMQKGAGYCGTSFYMDNAAGSNYNSKYYIEEQDGKEAADMPNTCKYSVEEATVLCNEVMKQLGIEDIYSVSYVDEIAEGMPSQGGSSSYIGYEIKYSRNVVGITETSDMFNGSDSVEEQNSLPYGFEEMYFRITDQGVEQFIWNSPMELGKVLADNVTLLEYSEIEDIFKNHVAIKFADVEEATTIHVNEIRFGWMRVKNKDKQDEFTLVPTWDYISDLYGRSSLLTINAIDGSILDRRYGY